MTAWCTPADVTAQPGCSDFDGDPGNLVPIIEAVSDVLFVRSGRQFATRTVTVRPCADPCAVGWQRSWGTTTSNAPGWCSCWSSSSACSCGAGPERLALGLGPVVEVAQVRHDGVTLVAGTDYRVDEATWIVRLPDAAGRARWWPATQRLDLDASEDDTFEVTVLVGEAPPRIGVLAAAELACEVNRIGSDGCRLDPRTVSVTRDGLTFAVVGLSDALASGRTGLPLVDLFLDTYNPRRLQRRARMVWPPRAGSALRTDTDGPS